MKSFQSLEHLHFGSVFIVTPSIYTTQYDNLSNAQKKRINVLNSPENLTLDLYLDEDENDLPPMPPLEDDEEVKSEPEETIAERLKLKPRKRKTTGTGLKIFTPNKLLSRLQIKAENN